MTTEEKNIDKIEGCFEYQSCKANCLRINVVYKPSWFGGFIHGKPNSICPYYIEFINKTAVSGNPAVKRQTKMDLSNQNSLF